MLAAMFARAYGMSVESVSLELSMCWSVLVPDLLVGD